MKVVRGLVNLRESHRGCVVTIGNFDGVHTGHQTILHKVKARAQALDKPAMLICFEPQPKEFFDVYQAPARLTRFREKVELLAQHGIDHVLCLKFNEKTRAMPTSEFISILTEQIKVSALFAGDDFRFGSNREGSFADLEAAGKAHGFEVTNLYTLVYDSARVSSTRIRACLADGDFAMAEKLLGHPYSITGKVVYGRRIGRTLGVPTANIQLHRYVAPIAGVFAVEMLLDGAILLGVANVGVRPTIDQETRRPILEVHIFDFDADIYGKTAKVIFRHKIREEKKFAGVEELKQAMAEDIGRAKGYFAQVAK
ncbi:MAG: bifunctional riboflavin kinase/FAD synthetase [Pseudomonadales bacterium]